MELKAYAQALRRRWPIIVFVPLIVGALAIAQELARDTTYSTTARLRVISAQIPGEFTDYPLDDNFLASEFAIDDLVEAVRGNVFSEEVAARARAAGLEIGGGDVQGAIAASREHRVLALNVRSSDPARAELIAREATAELEADAFEYIGQPAPGADAVVRVIDRPGAASADTSRARLLLALEIISALGIGVLLAFLIDYLDDTIQDGDSAAAALDLAHLASVPAERRR